MSEARSTLKQQNTGKLWTFIVANVAVFWAIFSYGFLDIAAAEGIVDQLVSPQGFGALLVSLLPVVLNGLFSPYQKGVIVYWRRRDPLPGSRAFSVHAREDARVDAEVLRERHGELPTAPGDQNALWYRLFKSHDTKPFIEHAHRQWLLTRDMTGLSVIFLVAFMAFLTVFGSATLRTELVYGAVLLAQYLLIRIAAKNYGESLVRNVLAEESAVQ